jgi:hypothetical protein
LGAADFARAEEDGGGPHHTVDKARGIRQTSGIATLKGDFRR